jgi:hypothetical protein
MQKVTRHYIEERVSLKSARILVSLGALMSILFAGAAQSAAHTAPAPVQPRSQAHTGRAPLPARPAAVSSKPVFSPLAVELAPGQDRIYPAFALEVSPDEELVYIPDTTTPGTWSTVAATPDTDYFAGDFVGGDYGRLYVLDFTANELHTLDTTTGADATIGASQPISGQVWTGATGTAAGTLYASSTSPTGGMTSYLYTVDTATGSATTVGEITNAPCIIDIAINAAGEMYGLEVCTDVLVRIDPATGAGTVIGSLGYDADFAQGMDFEETSGVLYLAAYNATNSRGELRIADTATGDSVLVGPFPDDAETDALAFAKPTAAPVQILQNPGFEDGFAHWQTEGYPSLSNDTFHREAPAARLFGEEAWAWQELSIPPDVTEVALDYWLTGISADTDFDNDILCLGIWDRARQTLAADACFGLAYFYSYPMVWRNRTYTLDAAELASVAGRTVAVGIRETQDWNPGYHKTSTAWVDDVALYVTRPLYDYHVYAPLVVRGQ